MTLAIPSLPVTVERKLPTKPSTAVTTHSLWMMMRSFQMTLSMSLATCVGTCSPAQVCLRLRALPPRVSVFSTRWTSKPCLARFKAEVMPATPPPITRPFWVMGTEIGLRESPKVTLAAAIRTKSFALAVAAWGSLLWTQELWLRILAISTRYSFKPAAFRVSRNSGSWVRGVQAAMTIRLRSCSRILFTIISWVSCEQEKRLRSTYTTSGSVAAYSSTALTSTTPAIFEPQWQMKTPIRGSSWEISFSSGKVATLVSSCLTGASRSATAAAAAEPSTTDWGMSFGPAIAPQV
ncbi:MAG: hypothetical protein ACD_75C02356G0002 [uncultured bacterium]|nr:MAG: hypothetical protein ACD_75C02356G0002 [uncultured bacterium]